MELAEFIASFECTHVAMEATGVYWKPVWHILEGQFELLLANAQHIKNVPGRKSDVNDATWIAELLAHGLIRTSFVPPAPIQALRDLTRTRKQLVREQTQHVQRIHKLLEDANLKLGTVLTDILGTTGRKLLGALCEGPTDPETLLSLVHKRVKARSEDLLAALNGQLRPHHRLLLRLHIEQVDKLAEAVERIDAEVGEQLRPFRRAYELLLTIPGVGPTVAQVLVAEIGVDMSRFATAGHLISWAGFCPAQNESAGKKKSTRLRKGAPWLKVALVQAGWAATRKKESYLRSQFLRLKSHMSVKQAVVAVAASILKAVFYMLRDEVPYKDLGGDYFDRRQSKPKLERLVRQIEKLGLTVRLDPSAANSLCVTCATV
jgi:transposase